MSDERAARLAEQLRANLLRRKGQRRAREDADQAVDDESKPTKPEAED